MDRASIRVEQALSSLIYKKVLKKRINLKEADESIGEILNLQVFTFLKKKTLSPVIYFCLIMFKSICVVCHLTVYSYFCSL